MQPILQLVSNSGFVIRKRQVVPERPPLPIRGVTWLLIIRLLLLVISEFHADCRLSTCAVTAPITTTMVWAEAELRPQLYLGLPGAVLTTPNAEEKFSLLKHQNSFDRISRVQLLQPITISVMPKVATDSASIGKTVTVCTRRFTKFWRTSKHPISTYKTIKELLRSRPHSVK